MDCKSYKMDLRENLDCSYNIKHLNDLINKNEKCVKKAINNQEEEERKIIEF